MSTIRKTQDQRRQSTQAQLLNSAIAVFAEKGFQDTNVQAIARHSGLTTRPIYHYFANKEGLFLAATEQLEQELASALQDYLHQSRDFSGAWQVFLSFATRQDFRQIVLIDAPNVLGRKRWQASKVIKTVSQFLAFDQQQQLLARMLFAALAEAALSIAEHHQDKDYIKNASDAVASLLVLLKQ